MKFYFGITGMNPMDCIPIAQAAEKAGFDGLMMGDSVIYPEHSDTEYPYNDDGSRDFIEQIPFIESFSLIPAMAAVTETLKFRTTVYKLTLRNPILAAKSVTSIAVLSNNRFEFGVGTGPWPEDFKACMQPWAKRGKRLDAMLEIYKGLESGSFYNYDGEHYQIESLKLNPVPTQPVPILIGGHADIALKRAARHDGWVHAGGSHEEMVVAINRIKALRVELGKTMDDFDIHVGSSLAFNVDGIKKLEALGVTTVSVGFHDIYSGQPDTSTLEEKIAQLHWYAQEIILKC